MLFALLLIYATIEITSLLITVRILRNHEKQYLATIKKLQDEINAA